MLYIRMLFNYLVPTLLVALVAIAFVAPKAALLLSASVPLVVLVCVKLTNRIKYGKWHRLTAPIHMIYIGSTLVIIALAINYFGG